MSRLVKAFWKMVEKSDLKRMSTLAVPEKVTQFCNLQYIDNGKKLNQLDIYRPEGKKGVLPLIIDIHGGGWWYGDKELNKIYCLNLTEMSGWAVANISYPLVPEVNYVKQLQDVFAAFNYIYQNAEKYELDLNNVFLTGDSAGGFLSLLSEVILHNEQLQALFNVQTSIRFNAIGLTCAVFDTTNLAKKFGCGIYLRPFYGEGYRKSPYFEMTNLFNYLTPNLSPIFLSTSYNDMLKKQVRKAFARLTEMGHCCQLCDWEKPLIKGHNLNHVFNILQPYWEESVRTNTQLLNFFAEQLK